MKPESRKRRFQQHIEQLRELGRQDAARRCTCCKRPLPSTGAAIWGGRWFCNISCVEDYEEASLLRQRTVQ